MRKIILLSIVLFICFQGFCQESLYAVRLRLKSEVGRGYIASEDPEMKAIAAKHGATFSRSCLNTDIPELAMYYDLTGTDREGNWVTPDAPVACEKAVDDFLATGKFENFVFWFDAIRKNWCSQWHDLERWFMLDIRLIPRLVADKNYEVTEDPEIKALVAKHEVKFFQPYPNAHIPNWREQYCIEGRDRNIEPIICDFMATGKFTNYVRGFELVNISSNTELINADSGMLIFPNPAENMLKISWEAGNAGEVAIKLYNITGNIVFETKQSLPCELNIEHLPAGIYFLQVFNENTQILITKKIIKS